MAAHVDLYYHQGDKQAFVILGHCKDFEEIMHYVNLFEVQTGTKLPNYNVVFRVIDLYKYKGMVVVKFPLSPKMIENNPEWIFLTSDNAYLLAPRNYK